MTRGFASDNNSGIDPEILRSISSVNEGHALAYGDDEVTQQAVKRFKHEFGEDTEVFFTFNGTGANTIALTSVTQSFQSVICSDIAHIIVDECGAPTKSGGFHMVQLKSKHGKIYPDDILPLLKDLGVQHHSQPATISITQSTEVGTVYTVDEIKAITHLAHTYGMKVHMDGARLSNAAVALDLPFRDFTVDAGIDILSFGGTKNGMMIGEAVLLFNQPSESSVRFVRKQCAQLYSKMRFISAQFLAYFENERWKKNAGHANKMAQLLALELSKIEHVKFSHKTEANGVFISIPAETIPELREHHHFYEWDSTPTIRLVTSFDTTESDVNNFVETLKNLL